MMSVILHLASLLWYTRSPGSGYDQAVGYDLASPLLALS